MNYTEKLLEVCDLHKVYTKDGVPTKALNGISFNVLNGEYLGIRLDYRILKTQYQK